MKQNQQDMFSTEDLLFLSSLTDRESDAEIQKQNENNSSLETIEQQNIEKEQELLMFDDEFTDYLFSLSRDFDASNEHVFKRNFSVEDLPCQQSRKRSHSFTSNNSSASAPQLRNRKPKNKKVKRNNTPTSKFRGVSLCNNDVKWQARIRIGKVVKYLGRFKEEVDAARRYDKAAKIYHKERAIFNFPDEQ